ncbi:MAG: Hsp70 family protein [Kofleriaceae bacterium]|nr:Hsp70 family protein [Kofleriaceae bacterium]MCB9574979.1 Hsp70 family protein [Kofleriaceae bacterium]
MNDPILGIDLGTSNTVVAVCGEDGQPRVLPDDNGYKIQPSVVSFHPNGSVIVGAEAKQRRIIDPRNTVYSVKRLIGRSFKAPEIATAQQRMPFTIKEGVNQQPVIVTRAGEFAIPEISAIVLDHVRNIARKALAGDVHRAVITVPANFVDSQRSATATAGAIAGLTVVRVLNEPTAAALAYGHQRKLNHRIAVYDFGGGTFDITVLNLDDQVYEVLGTAGDSFLGGDDLDERLVEHMAQAFLAQSRVDLREHELAMMRLRAVAEQTKIELSRRTRAIVKIDEIAYGPGGAPLDLQLELSRDDFVGKIADIVERTFPVCEEALKLAGVGVDGIDDVVLVGGTTKIPHVRDRVAAFFGKAPRTDINPEEAVAVGAALQAESLQRVLSGRRQTARSQVAPPGSTLPARPPSTPPPFGQPGRTTARRIGTEDGRTAVDATPTEPRRTTAPMGVPVQPPPVPSRGSTERAATRGASIDRLPGARMGTQPGTAPLGRITRPGAAPAPGRTMMGVPAAPTGGHDDDEVTGTHGPGEAPTNVEGLSGLLDLPPPEEITQNPTSPGMARGGAQAPTLMMDGGPSAFAPPPPAAAAQAPTLMGALPPPAPSAAAQAPTLMGAGPGALGAAAPRRSAPGPTVVDVTPRGLGIGTVAGYCEELIRRNSTVPAEVKRMFTTSRDRQDAVRIRVCQGESRRIDQNLIIGDLVLDGLDPRPRGETTIEVTFAIDHSGILQVRARDARTGREQRASLDILGAQSPAEVDAARSRLRELRT